MRHTFRLRKGVNSIAPQLSYYRSVFDEVCTIWKLRTRAFKRYKSYQNCIYTSKTPKALRRPKVVRRCNEGIPTVHVRSTFYDQIYKGFALWPKLQRICLMTEITKDLPYDQIYKGFPLWPNLQRISLMINFTKDFPYDQIYKEFPWLPNLERDRAWQERDRRDRFRCGREVDQSVSSDPGTTTNRFRWIRSVDFHYSHVIWRSVWTPSFSPSERDSLSRFVTERYTICLRSVGRPDTVPPEIHT